MPVYPIPAADISKIYELTASALAALGQTKLAFYWFGRAARVLDGACG